MGHDLRDGGDTRSRAGIQWRQGLLGGLAAGLGSVAGSVAFRTSESLWIPLLVIVAVVVLVMVAGRLLFAGRQK
jgi:hypothetical protein